MEKQMRIAILIVGMVIIFAFPASAFGASTPYWDENPLRLAAGESTIIELTLQNMMGTEDISLSAEITSDGEGIATLVNPDMIYSVPLGTENVKVPIEVTVPTDVNQGGKREVVVSFMQVSSEEEGMVSLSGGFTTKFIVEVVTEKESVLFESPTESESAGGGMPVWGWALMAIIIVAIAVFLIGKKDSKR